MDLFQRLISFVFFTCALAMLQAGIVSGNVCLSVCQSVRTKSRKLVVLNYRTEIDVTWQEHVPW